MVRFEPDERHALRSERGARVLMLLAPWPGDGHYRGSRAEASSSPRSSRGAAGSVRYAVRSIQYVSGTNAAA